MLYLRDLLPKESGIITIEYRCFGPKDEYGDREDMLFGYCKWDGENLISGDGDNYYLGDVITHYEWFDEKTKKDLTVWIDVQWSCERKESPHD